jgi:hypothetical protein
MNKLIIIRIETRAKKIETNFFDVVSISYFIPSFPLSQMLFWMLALSLSASVSLQSHKMWSTDSLTLQKEF